MWHFEMLNASGHVQYVVENISGCLGCMGVDRWPCQVLCHRSSASSDRGFILYTHLTSFNMLGLRVSSVGSSILVYVFLIQCVYTHTILIVKPGTWHSILANHFQCFRFPVANASVENISQVEAAVIGPAYNNMSFLVVAAKNPSLEF